MPNIAASLADDRNRAERRYLASMNGIMRGLKDATKNAQTPEDVINAANQYLNSPLVMSGFRSAAREMATMIGVGQYRTWREAAAASSRGSDIYRALARELTGPIGAAVAQHVENNSHLIKTVGQVTAGHLSNMAAEGWQKGLRPDQIAAQMSKEASSLAKYQIRRIARTESAKASTALVEARAEALGLDWYIWKTGKDERVRASHKAMEDVLCRWSDPPDPEAMAGEQGQRNNLHPRNGRRSKNYAIYSAHRKKYAILWTSIQRRC